MDNRKTTYYKLLTKLTNNTITEAERWTLEKESLTDPFLEEALEGYYNNQESLTQTKPRSNRSFFLWGSIAASVSLLLISSLYFNKPQDTTPLIAEVDNQKIEKSVNKTVQPELIEESSYEEPVVPTSSNNNKKQRSKSTKDINVKDITPPINKSDDPTSKETNHNSPIAQSDIPQLESQPRTESVPIQQDHGDQGDGSDLADVINIVEEESMDTDSPVRVESPKSANKTKQKVTPPTPLNKSKKEVVGVVRNKNGIPLRGVNIFDLNQELIAESNENGEFRFQAENNNRYITATIDGYNSFTTITEATVNIELQESKNKLNERHKTLNELYTNPELIGEYKNEIHSAFSKAWPLCDRDFDDSSTMRNALSIQIIIDNKGQIVNPIYYGDITEQCQSRIEDILISVSKSGIFLVDRPIEFRIRVNPY